MKTKLTILPSTNQKSISHELFDEIRALISADKYDRMTVATLLGVLEMLKMHYYHTNCMEVNE